MLEDKLNIKATKILLAETPHGKEKVFIDLSHATLKKNLAP